MLEKIKQAGYFIYGYWIAVAYRKASANKIDNRQQQRFKKLMISIADKAPFYRLYKNKKLSEFPIIDKAAFLAHFDDIPVANDF